MGVTEENSIALFSVILFPEYLFLQKRGRNNRKRRIAFTQRYTVVTF
ncbi:hypothetical protein Krac_12076 [Ktedonobacter racemifer DSM 44963]|uniref:Uncharacterized protein n=1 Tax=Ktedonobacter racemifer DSM 44963 TaxID=485913 RepID=D6TF55_KTERA|nr:hypothetical protein Krac_12076 [Ktedonobacter racemifer DSM 44963]